jgi:hypothetical protein
MWRITNILLLVFLVFALGAGSYVLYDDHLQYYDWGQDKKASRERTLNVNETVDEEGRKLRTQAVSFDSVIEYDSWGPWSVVPVQQSALSSPQVMSGDDDTIVLTSTTSEQLTRKSSPAQFADRASSIYTRFTNNLVLRNHADGSERPLFSEKVAITSILPLPHEKSPGVVAAYIGADTNGDGKIDESDETKVRMFQFNSGEMVDVPYAGRFISFISIELGDQVFSFTTYLDLDRNSERDRNFEPTRLFEADIETGAVRQAVSTDTVSVLQTIIDGPAGGE